VHVPILKQGGYLIATIQSVLSDSDLLQLRDDLAGRVGQFRSRGVIIDVTVLDVIDSFATRTLRGVAHMLKLRGADTVIVGIQPDVAFAMVQLGLTLEGVGTALDLEEGLAFLNARAKLGGVVARTRSAAATLSTPQSLRGLQGKRGSRRP
jgi:rsbT antagonist protein RsbS